MIPRDRDPSPHYDFLEPLVSPLCPEKGVFVARVTSNHEIVVSVRGDKSLGKIFPGQQL